MLINPNKLLLPEIACQLRDARKTKPLWAKRIEASCEVDTLEGRLRAQAGDYLCRGITGEKWPQKESKLLEKYFASNQFDQEGWQRFDPKPDSTPIEAVQMDRPFRVIALWGELIGKANDYVLRNKTEPTDVWVVDKAIFEASYEFLGSDRKPFAEA